MEYKAASLGLFLNYSKCEVFGLSPSNRSVWDTHRFGFKECALVNASLLGTPIQAGAGVDAALAGKRVELELLVKRLALLPAHSALFLIKNALAIPKLLYILRTAPCVDSSEHDRVRQHNQGGSVVDPQHRARSTLGTTGQPPGPLGRDWGTQRAPACTVCLSGFRCWCR